MSGIKSVSLCGVVMMMLGVTLLAGCATAPVPAPEAASKPAVVEIPATSAPALAPEPAAVAMISPQASAPQVASSASVVKPDARLIATSAALTPEGKSRYSCEVSGARNVIVLPEGTSRICSRFPAMGPCQYERDACRASGGRVIRFDGVEITKEVEHEYDKQVQRFRLNAG